jgi:hypothetical protein
VCGDSVHEQPPESPAAPVAPSALAEASARECWLELDPPRVAPESFLPVLPSEVLPPLEEAAPSMPGFPLSSWARPLSDASTPLSTPRLLVPVDPVLLEVLVDTVELAPVLLAVVLEATVLLAVVLEATVLLAVVLEATVLLAPVELPPVLALLDAPVLVPVEELSPVLALLEDPLVLELALLAPPSTSLPDSSAPFGLPTPLGPSQPGPALHRTPQCFGEYAFVELPLLSTGWDVEPRSLNEVAWS